MASTATLDVEGVDRATGEHIQGVVDRQALVETVGVQRDLHVVALGDVQRCIEGTRVSAQMTNATRVRTSRACADRIADLPIVSAQIAANSYANLRRWAVAGVNGGTGSFGPLLSVCAMDAILSL